jgi:hypothetical protein
MYALKVTTLIRMGDNPCQSSLINMATNTFVGWRSSQLQLINGIGPTTDENTITSLETNLSTTLNCLQNATSSHIQASSDVSDLYDEKMRLQREIDIKTKGIQVSKDRVSLLTNPEQKTTIYESWFPLERPLTITTVLILLVFGLFFISIFTGLLLRQIGVTIDVGFIRRIPGAGSFWAYFYNFINPLTLGLGAALVITISVIIYLTTKKG